MSSVTIREARREEFTIIAHLSRTTFYTAFEAQNTKEDMDLYLAEHFKPSQIAQEFDESGAKFFLAEIDGQIVGYAKVSTKYHPKQLHERKPLEVERLYVISACQGRKIGALLMEHCIAYAKENGREVIWLGVWEHNTGAIRFYERFGFSKFDEHDFILGNDVQNDWMMMLELSTQ